MEEAPVLETGQCQFESDSRYYDSPLKKEVAQSIRLGVTEVIRLDEDIVLKTTGR